MKKHTIAALLLGALSVPAQAVELTGNASFVSNYIWRGADQSNGKGAAQGGVDLAAGDGPVQFYAGAWFSTVEYEFLLANPSSDSIRGMEMDYYLGINGDISDFSWAVGTTLITYTDNVNPDYFEGNIALGYKWFSFDTAIGKYDADVPQDQNYIWAALTAEHNGFFGILGYTEWENDVVAGALADGGYFEVGFADTLEFQGVELFDYSISYLYSEADNVTANQASNNLILGITRNFGILD